MIIIQTVNTTVLGMSCVDCCIFILLKVVVICW